MVLNVTSFDRSLDDPTSLYGCRHFHDNDVNVTLFDATMTTKVKQKLDTLLESLIQSEKRYVRSMEQILNKIPPVHPGLKIHRRHLCATMENIYKFHKNCLLPDLEGCRYRPLSLGRCVLNWKEEFNLYTLHEKNSTRRRIASRHLWDSLANLLIHNGDTRSGTTLQGEAGIRVQPPKDRFDLLSYAFHPGERLGEWVECLDDVILCCQGNDPRKLELIDACALLKFHGRHGNDVVAMGMVVGDEGSAHARGCLLRQDNFLVRESLGKSAHARKLFLFEKCILVTKPTRKETGAESFTFLYQIETSEIVGFTESVGHNELKFEILHQKSRGRNLSDPLILHATSMDVKQSWIHDITRISSKIDDFLFAEGGGVVGGEGRTPLLHSGSPRHIGHFNNNFVRNVCLPSSDEDDNDGLLLMDSPGSCGGDTLTRCSQQTNYTMLCRSQPSCDQGMEIGILNGAFDESVC